MVGKLRTFKEELFSVGWICMSGLVEDISQCSLDSNSARPVSLPRAVHLGRVHRIGG